MFPQEIFDGRHSGRQNLAINRAPDYVDYKILVRELGLAQKYLLNLAQNTQIMPNLEGQLQAAQAQVEELRQLINDVTPPEDVIRNTTEFYITTANDRFDNLWEKGRPYEMIGIQE